MSTSFFKFLLSLLILLSCMPLYAAPSDDPPVQYYGPSLEKPEVQGTQLSPGQNWQQTLERAGHGTFLLRQGLYVIKGGSLGLQGITLKPFDGEVVTMVGALELESNVTVAGFTLDANDMYRCIHVQGSDKANPVRDVTIRHMNIYGGKGGGCVRIEGAVQDVQVVGNHIDGGAGPDGSSGHNFEVKGGCTKTKTYDGTLITWTCGPDNILYERNLTTKMAKYHRLSSAQGLYDTWSKDQPFGTKTEDHFQLEGSGSVIARHNVFWNHDTRGEEYIDIKTPKAGAVLRFEENYLRGRGITQEKSCAILQGDHSKSRIIFEHNVFDNCGWQTGKHALHAGGIKVFDRIRLQLAGNIFRCSQSGGGLVFKDTEAFSMTGNTIDGCTIAWGGGKNSSSKKSVELIQGNTFHQVSFTRRGEWTIASCIDNVSDGSNGWFSGSRCESPKQMALDYQSGNYRLEAPYGAKHDVMLAVARGNWEAFYGALDQEKKLPAPVGLHVVLQP